MSPFHISTVVERRLISGAKVRRNPFKCQFDSHVVEGMGTTNIKMLQKNYEKVRQNRNLEPQINDLASLCENQQQARWTKRVIGEGASPAEIVARSRFTSGEIMCKSGYARLIITSIVCTATMGTAPTAVIRKTYRDC
jgi:hypothetical protein